jgi:phage-related protein/predicted XRE-type DNA-binding protein
MTKRLLWLGSARRDIRGFPKPAKRIAGFQLLRVQQGLEPNDSKPMASIGAGVREIRIHTETEHRVCYVARFLEGIYVVHAFEKRTRKTSRSDLELARTRIESCWSTAGDKAMARAKARITRSSGNVFRDLGFGREEAEHLAIRSELMIKIERLLKARGLTQSQAASIMRVSQPRVSDLARGRLDLFSTDALIDMLARLGVSVRLAFASSKSRRVA